MAASDTDKQADQQDIDDSCIGFPLRIIMTDGPYFCHNRNMQQLLTAVLLLSATAWPASLAAECLHYGDVTLTGRLVQQTYPGPPDFESVTQGDEPLVIWILQLDRGVCIISGDSSYSSAYNEREIQLVLGNDPYARTAALCAVPTSSRAKNRGDWQAATRRRQVREAIRHRTPCNR